MNYQLFIKPLLLLVSIFFTPLIFAQTPSWQQKVDYVMDIKMNVDNHKFEGSQKLIYYNNSPDTLNKVYYHLYFNAFQPGSMMDMRSLNIADPDPRVGTRISKLKPDEIGYHNINSLKQNGKDLQFEEDGTVISVTLNEPILPNGKSSFDMTFSSQVPVQIRRSGRNNNEGVDYSMAQWYPKMAEYDYMGWHVDPYIGREFHGVWGSFDVKITIDKNYTLAATGYLQNPNEIGHGYENEGTKVPKPGGDLTWHFKVDSVMDFVWAADPDYVHLKAKVPNDGPTFHFFYIDKNDARENWQKLVPLTIKNFEYINERFGKYPYKQYSVIQGGDGGMEYPMATLITGDRSVAGLIGVTRHELLHSWYQHLLGTNELMYAWMDEGFTTYASTETAAHLEGEVEGNPHRGTYQGYYSLVNNNLEEPSSLHADHFNRNIAYSVSAYLKGSIFLNQLSYIIGQEAFDKGMRIYFNTWKFKHPTPYDFIRIMEKQSDMVLDWYQNYWIETTKTIDYGIKSVDADGNNTIITLTRVGQMPMPIDLAITFKDGSTTNYNIPLQIMRNEKKADRNMKFEVVKDWQWTNPDYKLTIPQSKDEIDQIQIDPTERLADINANNNRLKVQ